MLKLQNRLVLLLLVSLSPASFAKGSSSGLTTEFFHKAPAGSHELTPSFNYTKADADIKVSGPPDMTINAEIDEKTLGLKYEYGINDMFSAGIELGYKTGETKMGAPANSKSETKGMLDPVFYGIGNYLVGPGLLHWKLSLNWALADEEEDSVADPEESNATEGYNFADLRIGYAAPMGGGVFGGALTYGIYQADGTFKDKDAGTSTDFENEAAMALDVFYEMPSEAFLWGVNFQYSLEGDQKFKDTATNINPGEKRYSLIGYFDIPLGSGNLLPKVTYSMLQENGSTTSNNYAYDGGTAILVDLAYRLTF